MDGVNNLNGIPNFGYGFPEEHMSDEQTTETIEVTVPVDEETSTDSVTVETPVEETAE